MPEMSDIKISKVWSVWFSATGTTRKVVRAVSKGIASGLDCPWEEYSFNLPNSRAEDLSFSSTDLVVFGLPVYAGRVPNLLLPYVRDKVKGNGALVVPIVLYGNRNFDDGLIELRNVLSGNGFCPVTAGAFVGEHSFSKILGAGRPDEEDMSLAENLAQATVSKVKSLLQFQDSDLSQSRQASQTMPQMVAVEGQDPIRPYYTPRDRYGKPIADFLKAKPETDPEKCVKCGLCARLCPLGSINPENVSQVGKCFKCCACVKNCPKGAKYFTHEGYLYHQHELEDQYAGRRAESKIFT